MLGTTLALSSKRNVITFKFQVTPRLITTTGNSCGEDEVFSHEAIRESLALEPRTVNFIQEELSSDRDPAGQ